MVHLSNIDDLKAWFLRQGERTQWKLWASDRVPAREENSTSLIMFQKDSAINASESFDILAQTLKSFQTAGGYFTVRVFKVENDPRGPAVTIKLEPQSYVQSVGTPSGIGNSAPVTVGNEKHYERIYEMQSQYSNERMDLKLDILKKDHEIARLKDLLVSEKKRQDAGIGNAIVKSGQLPELIGTAIAFLKGEPSQASVSGPPKRGLYKADADAEDTETYANEDDTVEVAAPSCDRFMAQANYLGENYGIQANDALDIVAAIFKIAETQGIEARLLFGNLYEKVKANPSLLKMIV